MVAVADAADAIIKEAVAAASIPPRRSSPANRGRQQATVRTLPIADLPMS